VLAALEALGFRLVREGNHIAMLRENDDGTRTPLTLPNHRTLARRYGASSVKAVSVATSL
jgi:hypothetical protein